jgi:hypothetical protein
MFHLVLKVGALQESLISMEWTSSLSEQPSKEEDNTSGVEVKLLESKMYSLNSCGVSLFLSRCMWLSSLRGIGFFLSHRLSRWFPMVCTMLLRVRLSMALMVTPMVGA